MGHCWRSKDELISDIRRGTTWNRRPNVGRPATSYIKELCVDTGCSLEDLPEAMNDRDGWRERADPYWQHDMKMISSIPKYLEFSLFLNVLMFFRLSSSIPTAIFRYEHGAFLMSNSIPIYWMYFLWFVSGFLVLFHLLISLYHPYRQWECPRGVMVKVMDCKIGVSEFEPKSRC